MLYKACGNYNHMQKSTIQNLEFSISHFMLVQFPWTLAMPTAMRFIYIRSDVVVQLHTMDSLDAWALNFQDESTYNIDFGIVTQLNSACRCVHLVDMCSNSISDVHASHGL